MAEKNDKPIDEVFPLGEDHEEGRGNNPSAESSLGLPPPQMVDAHEHKPLADRRREIASRIHFRIGGCQPGSIIAEPGIQNRDAAAVHILDGALTIDPEKVQGQLDAYDSALASVQHSGNDLTELRRAMSVSGDGTSFLEVGGQSHNIPAAKIVDVIRQGFMLIMEYVESAEETGGEEVRFPVGYHFGYTRMPRNHSTLSADSATGADRSVRFVQRYADKIYTIWRTGVLREMTEQVRSELAAIGVDVPSEMVGESFQRMSISALTKLFTAKAAEALGRKYVFCNIGRMLPAGEGREELLDYSGMPNGASLGANSPLFTTARMVRRPTSAVRTQQRGAPPIAHIHWDVYGRPPSELLDAVLHEKGVYKGKGSIPFDRMDAQSDMFVDYLKRKEAK